MSVHGIADNVHYAACLGGFVKHFCDSPIPVPLPIMHLVPVCSKHICNCSCYLQFFDVLFCINFSNYDADTQCLTDRSQKIVVKVDYSWQSTQIKLYIYFC